MIAVDYQGNEFKIGQTCIYGSPNWNDPEEFEKALCKVIDITVDIRTFEDEYGGEYSEPVGLVHVRFEDGDKIECSGLYSRNWSEYLGDEAYEIDDLEGT